MNKPCSIIFAVALLIASMCVSVRAYSGDVLIAANGSAPTIDGSIGASEWADSSTLVIAGNGHAVTVYAKQDGNNLYIAVPGVADDTPLDGDYIGICIDVNHDGGSSLQSDDIYLLVSRLSSSLREFSGTASGWGPDVSPTGWTAAAAGTATAFDAEFSISYAKIGVTAGVPKTLGMLLAATNNYPLPQGGTASGPGFNLPWASDDSWHSPGDWAEIVVGTPTFVVPEFWLGPVLGLTGCFAAFGTYYMLRRRRIYL